MMQYLRERVGKWVVRIIMVLLILGFAAWDLSGYMTGRIGNPFEVTAVRAGDINVSLREVEVRLIDEIAGETSLQEAIDNGRLDSVLDEVRRETLMDAEAMARTLLPSANHVADMILADPRFRREDGSFDGTLLERVLQQERVSEARFLEQERQRIGRSQIQLLTLATPLVPEAISRRIAVYQQETRQAELIRLAPDPAIDALTPTEEELVAFHEPRRALYRAPERRVLEVLRVIREETMERIQVGEPVLERMYERRTDELRRPETRDLRQWLFDDALQAEAAIAASEAGEPFEALAQAAGTSDAVIVPLEDTAMSELPPGLRQGAEAIFAADIDAVLGPYQSELGFHVVQVTGRTASRLPTYEEVRDDLLEEYRQEEVDDTLLDLVAAVEDELAAGRGLAEAAERLELTLYTTPPLDANGTAPLGQFMPMALGADAIRQAVTEAGFGLSEAGQNTGLLAQPDNGGLWVGLNEIEERRILELEEARAQVLADWRDSERERDLAERARPLGQALELGQSVEEVAAMDPLSQVETVAGVFRDGRQAGPLAASLVTPLFEAELRAVLLDITPQEAQLARLVAITRPSIEEAEPGQLTEQLEGVTNNTLDRALMTSLEETYEVTINRDDIIRYLTEESDIARFMR